MIKKNTRYTLASQATLLVALSMTVALPAYAQETYALDEIVVTAQKRKANLQDVAISISSYSGEFIENSKIATIQDLSLLSPNLQVAQTTQTVNQRISIRGVGSDGNNALEPSVALYIDGVYITRPGALLGDLHDIGSVDVLRGPQGTLFGRNASMGVLDIHTRKPHMDNEASIEASAGNYGSYSVKALLNTPISDNMAARFSGVLSRRDGYGDNKRDGSRIGDRDNFALRGAVLLTPSKSVEAILRLDYANVKGENGVIVFKEDTVTPIGLTNYQNALGGAIPLIGGDPFEVNQFYGDNIDDEQYGVSLDLSFELGSGHVVRSISAYRDWKHDSFELDVLRTPLNLISRTSAFSSDMFSQEITLLSPEDQGPFSYVAGVFYLQEDYALSSDFSFGTEFCPVFIANFAPPFAGPCAAGAQDGATTESFSQNSESWAVYGQGTLGLSDKTDLTLGLRWTKDDKDGQFESAFNNVVGSLIRGNAQNDLTYSDEALTWVATLQHRPTENTMLFATASTGYKAGGFNAQGTRAPLTLAQRIYDPEKVTNFELGVKSTLMDGRATANVTLYRTEIDGFQERTLDNVSFIINNAGTLRQQGVELDVNTQLSRRLSASLSVAYLDSEYLDFTNASALPGQPGSQDLTGGRAPFSPELSSTLIAKWTDTLGGGSTKWFVQAEHQYISSHSTAGSSDGNPQVVQDGYSLMNLRAGIGNKDKGWRVTLYGQNIADKNYFQRTFYQPFGAQLGVVDGAAGTSAVLGALGAPRTYGVSVSYDFH